MSRASLSGTDRVFRIFPSSPLSPPFAARLLPNHSQDAARPHGQTSSFIFVHAPPGTTAIRWTKIRSLPWSETQQPPGTRGFLSRLLTHHWRGASELPEILRTPITSKVQVENYRVPSISQTINSLQAQGPSLIKLSAESPPGLAPEYILSPGVSAR